MLPLHNNNYYYACYYIYLRSCSILYVYHHTCSVVMTGLGLGLLHQPSFKFNVALLPILQPLLALVCSRAEIDLKFKVQWWQWRACMLLCQITRMRSCYAPFNLWTWMKNFHRISSEHLLSRCTVSYAYLYQRPTLLVTGHTHTVACHAYWPSLVNITFPLPTCGHLLQVLLVGAGSYKHMTTCVVCTCVSIYVACSEASLWP